MSATPYDDSWMHDDPDFIPTGAVPALPPEPEPVITPNNEEGVLTLEQILDRFVLVGEGELVCDIRDPGRRMNMREFRSYYAKSRAFSDNGRPVSHTATWLVHRDAKRAKYLTLDPAQRQWFVDGQGFPAFNTWRPPSWPRPGTLSAAAPFLRHVEYLFPSTVDREWFLDWLAHAVQQPHVRPHQHPCLIALRQGTGRGLLTNMLAATFGNLYAPMDLNAMLGAQFNGQFSGRVLAVAEEVYSDASEMFRNKNKLKGLLTETVWTINPKHLRPWQEPCLLRVIMQSNHEGALPLEDDDRRVRVIQCAHEPRGADYFAGLYGIVNTPVRRKHFAAALWWWLMTRDVSAFNPGERAPDSEGKRAMQRATRSPRQQELAEIIDGLRRRGYHAVYWPDLYRLWTFGEGMTQPVKDQIQRELRGLATDLRCRAARRRVKVEKELTSVLLLDPLVPPEATADTLAACGAGWLHEHLFHRGNATLHQVLDDLPETGGLSGWSLERRTPS